MCRLSALALVSLCDALSAPDESVTLFTGGVVDPKDGSVPEEWKPLVAMNGQDQWDRGGYQTALSGDSSTVAIGLPFNSNLGGERAGSVRVYTRNGLDWHQKGPPINGDQAFMQAGFTVTISFDGNAVAFGSPYYNHSYKGNIGVVRVYHWSASSSDQSIASANPPYWYLKGSQILGQDAGDKCGFSIALGARGMNLAIGSPLKEAPVPNPRPLAGVVRVFKFDDQSGDWVSKGQAIHGVKAKDLAGVRVAMSGDANSIAFVSPGMSDDPSYAGKIRVYTFEGNKWELKGQPVSGAGPGDKGGRSLAFSRDGLNLAVGSPAILNGSGHTRVYTFNDKAAAWIQKGAPLPGGGAYSGPGHNIAVNTDGSVVAIGSPFAHESGLTAGRVRLFSWKEDARDGSGGTAPGWVTKGEPIDGEPGDTSGYSVSISGKGNMIAIGAPQFHFSADADALFVNAAVEPGARMMKLASNMQDDAQHALEPYQLETDGPGKVRISGAFGCQYLGDLQPPSNPY
jgi:hypothetical protein